MSYTTTVQNVYWMVFERRDGGKITVRLAEIIGIEEVEGIGNMLMISGRGSVPVKEGVKEFGRMLQEAK